VAATAGPDAAWVLPARPPAVGQLRRRAVSFAVAAGATDDVVERIAFAVSEAVTNTVLHAYGGGEGEVALTCRLVDDLVVVEVTDQGVGIAPRRDSPGIGHGLTIVGALAQTLDIGTGPGGRGTRVTMGFRPPRHSDSSPGLEALCALALQTVADASCVDLVHQGVLRRVVAEVSDEPALTAWLRGAMPPAKPGTATWAALREGGAHLVVHDPSVSRSPSGPGERLGLTWWVAVAVRGADGDRAAVWGFGGRRDGRPVPPDQIVRILDSAAQGDLAQPAERAILRARLALATG
jgi:serine/threonine-protein kinase RsbW